MSVKLLTAQARLSLHLSKYHFVGNHMSCNLIMPQDLSVDEILNTLDIAKL